MWWLEDLLPGLESHGILLRLHDGLSFLWLFRHVYRRLMHLVITARLTDHQWTPAELFAFQAPPRWQPPLSVTDLLSLEAVMHFIELER